MKQATPHTRWPSGGSQTVALLRLIPEELSATLGIRFEVGEDDLGPYKLAAFDDREAGQVWLFAHDRAPASGTEVRIDLALEAIAGLEALLRLIPERAREVNWLTPSLATGPRTVELPRFAGRQMWWSAECVADRAALDPESGWSWPAKPSFAPEPVSR